MPRAYSDRIRSSKPCQRVAPPLPVARHRDLQGPKLPLQPLAARSVAAVAAAVALRRVPLVAQMRRQLRLQRSLHNRLRQLLQQPVLPGYLLHRGMPLQHLVDQLLIHSHFDLLAFIRKDRLHKMVYTLGAKDKDKATAMIQVASPAPSLRPSAERWPFCGGLLMARLKLKPCP